MVSFIITFFNVISCKNVNRHNYLFYNKGMSKSSYGTLLCKIVFVIALSFLVLDVFSQDVKARVDAGKETTNDGGVELLQNQEEKTEETNTDTAASELSAEEQLPILESSETFAIQPIGIWDTVRVFVVLGIIIAAIYLCVWMFKKMKKKTFVNSGIIDVVSSKTLIGGGNVHLVKIGKSFLLLGAASQNVSLLKEIKIKEEVDEIQLNLSASESVTNPSALFWTKMKSVLGGLQISKHNVENKKNKVRKKSSVYLDTVEILKDLFKKSKQQYDVKNNPKVNQTGVLQ